MNNIENLNLDKNNTILIVSTLSKIDRFLNEKNIHLIIFDLDGTLLNSMSIWDNLCFQYLNSLNIENIQTNIKDEINKLSLYQAILYIKDTYKLQKTTDEIYNDITNIIYNSYTLVKLKNGVKKYIEKLFKKNIILTIATANEKKITEVALKNNDILKYFSIIRCESDVKVSKADGPNIYDSILEELNISKDNVVVYEDSAHCIKTLKKNDYFTIGVKDSSCREDIKTLCDYYIDNFEDEL